MSGLPSPDAVNQFHAGTSVGDAITDQMLTWRDHLRALGFRSEIYAEHIHPDLRSQIRPITSYLGSPSDLLIVHHSMGYGAFETVLGLPDRKILAYHNITPDRFFDDPHTKRFIRLGQRQLRRFAAHAAAAVAVSAFNRRDLIRAGYERASVIPVKTAFEPLPVQSLTRTADWLFVGRVVPNKRQLELVEAFAHHASVDPRVRLHIVGDVSFHPYTERVVTRARALGIEHRVLLHGKVSDLDLRKAYAHAGAFVCLSEHEGFGVPLLEAMAAGLPVVARAAAAVPETMGGAGTLLHHEDPSQIAATVQQILSDDVLRRQLVANQLDRIARIREFDVRGALGRLVREAIGEARPLDVQIQGPFETSYSLAILNRRLAVELSEHEDVRVSIYATEGPGDYVQHDEDLDAHPDAAVLYDRARDIPYPDVVIRQMYPPRVADSPGGVNLQYFGWEETRVPEPYVLDFNEHLNGIGTMSTFVADALRESGLRVHAEPVGVGVEAPVTDGSSDEPELADLPAFRFLHISSAFPRKGVDVLLRAYFDAFSASDDVTLVVKTFPNPHNDVGTMLAELRRAHPDPPDVRWIDRDLDLKELQRLYGVANCYVHTSRGEGFGLPVAEAMLAGVPVIAIAQSGTADFVDETVAVTIPYEMVPAASHTTLDRAEWADPDRDAVSRAMRTMYDTGPDDACAQRVELARRRITETYSWGAVARRWSALIERARAESFVPNVAFVSTWNSRCGIAEYSKYLLDGIGRAVSPRVFANAGQVLLSDDGEDEVLRPWRNYWEPDLDELALELLASDADVVHVQFNFGFFEIIRLARLFQVLAADGRAVVLTLHATHEPTIDGELVRLADIALPLSQIDRIIVHQPSDAERLAAFGVARNVEVVPHGAAVGGLPNRHVVRDALGVGDRPVVGTFGFALPHKGLIELIRAVDLLRVEHPGILLLACSSIHDDPISMEYFTRCEREVHRLRLGDNVRLIPDFLADVEARTLLSASDVIVLPYEHTPESASGALRFVIGVGAPILTTAVSIFDDAVGIVDQVPSNDPALLASGVARLLADDAHRQDITSRCATYAQSVSWSAVGRRHAQIYREIARPA